MCFKGGKVNTMNVMMSIQIIPKPNDHEDVIEYVDEAIRIIDESGLNYRVGPLETTIEGTMSQCLSLIDKMHSKMQDMGSKSTMSQIKIYQSEAHQKITDLTYQYDEKNG